jgi:cytidylate kinase
VEFNRLAEEDDQIDRDLDRRLRTVALERDDVLLESRLAGWLAGDAADLRLWLDAPIEVRAARIADREAKSAETALTETREREESEALRYREYYGIDIADLSIYDVALNTARWSEHEVPRILTAAVEAYDPGSDEGKYAVDGVSYDF